MKTLEQVLADIESIAKKKDLKYHLDTKFEDSTGARVIIRWVKPFNNIIYTHLLIGGISNSPKGLAEVIEEEVVIEITIDGDKWADKWNWTKHLTNKETNKESVLRSSILEIQDALRDTDWLLAHTKIKNISDRDRTIIKMWNEGRGQLEIGESFEPSHSPKTVANIIGKIRKANSKYVKTREEHHNS